MKKIMIVVLMILAYSNTSFGQSKKMEAKAMESTEQLGNSITAGEGLALTDEQKDRITALYMEKAQRIKEAKKNIPNKDDFKEERKKISKEINSKINKDVLTKEQRKAKSKGKIKEED